MLINDHLSNFLAVNLLNAVSFNGACCWLYTHLVVRPFGLCITFTTAMAFFCILILNVSYMYFFSLNLFILPFLCIYFFITFGQLMTNC